MLSHSAGKPAGEHVPKINMDVGVLMIIGICAVAAALLYLLMIMPRVAGRPDGTAFGKWLYAHRGLHDNETDAPENSLRAFSMAADEGFGIELDVQLTKDGIPVVFHDFTLKRICGAEGKICEYTFQELQRYRLCGTDQKVPRLEEVLELVGGRVPLIVELKAESVDIRVCGEADRLLSRYDGMYCVESFNPLAMFWYRRHRKRVFRGQLSDAFLKEGEYVGVLYFLLQNLLLNWLSKPDFIAYNCKYPQIMSRRLCRSLYCGTAVAWTVRSREQMEEAGKHFDIFIFEGFRPERMSMK